MEYGREGKMKYLMKELVTYSAYALALTVVIFSVAAVVATIIEPLTGMLYIGN